MTIQEKRRNLQAEIEVASDKLYDNLESTNFLEYVKPGLEILPSAAANSADKNPFEFLHTMNLITRTVLPENNMLRKILYYLSLGTKVSDKII